MNNFLYSRREAAVFNMEKIKYRAIIKFLYLEGVPKLYRFKNDCYKCTRSLSSLATEYNWFAYKVRLCV